MTRGFRLTTMVAAACLAVPLTMGATMSRSSGATESAAAKAQPGDWSTWQKDVHGSRFNGAEHAITAANAGKLKLKWAFAYPKDAGDPHSQPAIVDGVAYFGAPGGTFYARDAKTGAAKWEFDTGTVTGGGYADIHDGPSVSGGKIYFAAGAYLIALDQRTGKLAWSQQLDTVMAAGITSSPIVFDGRVYVGVSSGENIMGKDHACCTFRGHLDALDAKTGKLDWRYYTVPVPKQNGTWPSGAAKYEPSGAGVWSSPAVDPDTHTVYVGTGQNYTGHGGHFDTLLALDAKTGKERWTRGMTDSDTWRRECGSKAPEDLPYCPNLPKGTALDFDLGAAPNLFTVGGKHLVGIGQKSGVYHVMDATTGKVIWRRQLSTPKPNGGSSGIEWGSSFDGKRLYIATWMANPGTLFALDPATGHVLWKTPNPADGCKTGGASKYPKICKLGHTPAVTSTPGVVWEGSMDGKMRAYSSNDGKVLWTFDTMQDVKAVNGVGHGGSISGGGGAVVSGGLVYVQTGYFFNPYPNDKGAALMVFGL